MGSSTSGVLGRVQRVFCRSEYQLGKFDETWPLVLLKLEHQSDNLNNVVRVSLLELGQATVDEAFTIIDLIPLVEPCNVLHGCTLVEDQTTRKDVRFVNIVVGMA